MPDSQTEISELAREVVDELKDTRQIGDQLLLSRREAIALSTGAVSLGALGVAGAGTASAQEAAGQIGTEAEPVDVEGAQGNFSQGVSVDGALEAEQATVDLKSPSEGVTKPLLSFANLVDNDFEDRYKQTTVGTTAETIISHSGIRLASIVIVTGSGPSPSRFADLIFYSRGSASVRVVASVDDSSSGRSYSTSGNDGDLKLAMDADEYKVSVRSLEAGGTQT